MLLLPKLVLLGLHVSALTGQEQGLPCTYLAHHDLDCISITFTVVALHTVHVAGKGQGQCGGIKCP